MRNWEDKLEWSQRSSLVFQTAKCILHILKQLSIVRLDFCFTIFDRVLKDNTTNKQIRQEKPRVLKAVLLCQCCNFSASGLTLANCSADVTAPSPPPVCLQQPGDLNLILFPHSVSRQNGYWTEFFLWAAVTLLKSNWFGKDSVVPRVSVNTVWFKSCCN